MTSPISLEHSLSGPLEVPSPRVRSMLIDVTRGFAITLVALGHTNQGVIHRGWWGASPVGVRLGEMIYAFHMPAFFFISGVFLLTSIEKRGPGHFVAGRLRGILWPYLLFSVISALSLAVFARYTLQPAPTFRGFLVSLAVGTYGWFLPTIFLALMLALAGRRVPMPLFFVAAAALSTWYPFGTIPIVTAALKLLPFLILGMWVGRGYERLERIPPWLAGGMALMLAGVLVVVTPSLDVHWSLLYIPLGVVGTLMLLLVARVLGRSGWARGFAWIGEASFGIFLLSSFPQGGTRELLLRLHQMTNPYVQTVLPTMLAVAVPALLYHARGRLRIGWMFVFPY